MTGSNFGPYRATTLWNEAVVMFRDNMPLQEHRHRLHKHQNSFSGHDAVSFLHEALRSNKLFNSDVTRDQACLLLKQFLKWDLISPVQNCSVRNDKRDFHDSNKFLYEFTEKLCNFQRLTPLSSQAASNSKINISSSDSEKENVMNLNSEKSWKWAIIKRIIDLLKPLDVSELRDLKEINPKWVTTNGDPEWSKLKWNTELPPWILSTMQQLLKYSSKDYCNSAYPSFHMDAFSVICGYFKTLENPVILQCFYKIYIKIFKYLEHLNNPERIDDHEMKMSGSQEDLLYRISSPQKRQTRKDVSFPCNNLPPNHCYEAFISDDLTFRVVPQSSVDSVHLQKGVTSETHMNDYSSNSNISLSTLDNIKVMTKKTPLRPINKYNSTQENYCKIKNGIVNEGFAIFSPPHMSNKKKKLLKSGSYDCLRVPAPKESYGKLSEFSNDGCYVNHGLSFSLEDMNLLASDRLDYSDALESLERLMKVSKYNSSSDDDYSYHTALSSSETDLTENELFQESIAFEENNWSSHIKSLGITIFQLLLMLLPPCNRAQLKNLSVVMSDVSESSTSPGLSLQTMVNEISKSILRPPEDDSTVNNLNTEIQIVLFIVRNHAKIFSELSPELLSVITNEIYECQLQAFSYCKQISRKQFEDQKHEESNVALLQLLDHLINNKAISEKERRKHLKVFKEAYPSIYKSHFPTVPVTTKSKKLISFKNFRL